MARKNLIRGTNAQRVEKRIANTPKDLDEISIFSVLKEMEESAWTEESEKVPGERRALPKNARQAPVRKSRPRNESQTKKKPLKSVSKIKTESTALNTVSANSPVSFSQAKPANKQANKPRSRAGVSLTKSEREIIVKSCIAYRNGLPIYLKHTQEEVKTIDNLIKKLTLPYA